jgi:hypothetical protein
MYVPFQRESQYMYEFFSIKASTQSVYFKLEYEYVWNIRQHVFELKH